MVASRSIPIAQLRGCGDGSGTKVPSMPVLTPRHRSGKPVRRPPHIVNTRVSATSAIFDGTADSAITEARCHSVAGIAPAPSLPDGLDDVDQPLRPVSVFSCPDSQWTCRSISRASAVSRATPDTRASSPGHRVWSFSEEEVAGCAGGRIHRPDTCYLTHTYVKQEISYLSRRVDEIARYFVALEQMLGTGALGPLLEKSYRELEVRMEAAHEIHDLEEVQGLIDAAVRLGLSPKRYSPLRQRQAWLETGMKKEQLLRQLEEIRKSTEHAAGGDAGVLEQLIDDCVRMGIDAKEISVARKRFQQVQQAQIDEVMLAAASVGDIPGAEAALRRGATCDAQKAEGGASLWHIAAAFAGPASPIVELNRRWKASFHLVDDAGRTPLMTAAACMNLQVLKQLLACGADPSARTEATEQIVECNDEAAVNAICAHIDPGGNLLMSPVKANAVRLDCGDKYVGGADLQLPVFRRAAGRTPLHFAAMRAGHDGTEEALIDVLVRHDAEVNSCDELGRTPLWYAAQGGHAAGTRALLRHGASVVVQRDVSPLITCARSHAVSAAASGEQSEVNECREVLRLLLRHGASRGRNQVRHAAAAFSDLSPEESTQASFSDFVEACRKAQSLSHAITLAGGAAGSANMSDLQKTSALCEATFRDLFPFNHWSEVSSAKDLAALTSSAMEEFEELSISLARETGARVVLGRAPSASTMSRLARSTGWRTPSMKESDVAWFRVTGAVHNTLVYQDIGSIVQAMEKVKVACGHHIRGFEDLLTNTHGDQSMIKSMKSVAWVRRPGGIVFSIEVDGVICCLRLTVAHVLEVEEAQLEEGVWLLEEVIAAIKNDSTEELQEAFDFAAEHLDAFKVAGILDRGKQRQPKRKLSKESTASYCEGDQDDPPVCMAVSLGRRDALELLLQASASPNASSANEYDALTLAALREDLPCFLRLLSAGADTALEFDDIPEGEFRTEAQQLLAKVSTQLRANDAALAELVQGFDGCPHHLREAEYLLSTGSNPNAKIAGGMTLLSCAVEHKSMPLVKLLIRRGALVGMTGPPPTSALFLSRGGHAEMTIHHQASKELQAAASESNIPAIHALLEVGMDPESMVCMENKGNTEAQTLLEYAVELQEDIAVPLLDNLLKRGAFLERRDDAGQTALINVVRARCPVKITETLLSHDADVFAADKDGVTAVMYAAAAGQCEVLVALLDAGKKKGDGRDVGLLRDQEGQDAMMHAVAAMQASAVQLLLSRSYSMDRRAVLSKLFSACRSREVQTLRQLLDISSQVFPTIAAAAEDGVEHTAVTEMPTLLMEAVRSGSPDAVKVLLAYGAPMHPHLVQSLQAKDISSKDIIGESAWSLTGSNCTIQAVLREALPQELVRLVGAGNTTAAAKLQAEEARGLVFGHDDFIAVDEQGLGVLDHAVQQGEEELETWFIKRGARFMDVATRASALMDVAKAGSYEAALNRIEAGADVSTLDTSKRTVLDWNLIASWMSGYVWHSVNTALQTVVGDDEEVASTRSDRPSVCSRSTSLSMRLQFAPNIELQEIAANDAQPLFQAPRLDRRSFTETLSVSGRSTRSSQVTSSGRQIRRKKPDPPPDPRQVHAKLEEALIQAGARFSPDAASWPSCLWDPLIRGDTGAVRRRILGGGDCTLVNDKGISLPHFCLDVANYSIANLFVDGGASPDSRDHRGRTVLWRAVEAKQRELVDTCIKRGADLSLGLGSAGGSGEGSLAHLALETGQPQLAIIIIKEGCSPNKTESHGRTVLWRALELSKTDVALTCLEYGADTSMVDPFTGKTVLHLALERPNMVSAVGPLIEAYAPLNLPDKHGQTPMILASSMGERGAVNAFLERGVLPGTLGGREAHIALQAGHFELAEDLIKSAGPLANCLSVTRKWHKQEVRRSLLSPAESGNTLAEFKDSEVNWLAEILTQCAEADAPKAATACLSGAVEGAGISADEVQMIVPDLVAWAFKRNPPFLKQARLDAIQALPRTMAEEGKESAASDLLQAGVPDEIVERLAYLTHEHRTDHATSRRCTQRSNSLKRGSLFSSTPEPPETPNRGKTRHRTGGSIRLSRGETTSAFVGLFGLNDDNIDDISPAKRRMRRCSTAPSVQALHASVERSEKATSSASPGSPSGMDGLVPSRTFAAQSSDLASADVTSSSYDSVCPPERKKGKKAEPVLNTREARLSCDVEFVEFDMSRQTSPDAQWDANESAPGQEVQSSAALAELDDQVRRSQMENTEIDVGAVGVNEGEVEESNAARVAQSTLSEANFHDTDDLAAAAKRNLEACLDSLIVPCPKASTYSATPYPAENASQEPQAVSSDALQEATRDRIGCSYDEEFEEESVAGSS